MATRRRNNAKHHKMSKKEQKLWGKILFWLFIGWWFYIYKFVLWDIPKWIIKKVKNQKKSKDTVDINSYRISDTPEITVVTDTPEKIEKTKALKLNADEVIERYITTNHYTAPAEFSHFEYKQKEFETILNALKPVDIAIGDDFKAEHSPSEYHTKNLTTKTNIQKAKDFIAIDTETTGLSIKSDKIIEVSAILFKDFKPVSIFHTFINPEKNISKKATEINGITKEMVANAPRFEQISKSLSEFVSGYPLVAHNAPFDMKFLAVSGLDISPKAVIYDTLELSRRLFEDLENYKLQTVCDECCIYFSNAHRSSSDALAAGLLFNEIIKQRMETTNLYSLI